MNKKYFDILKLNESASLKEVKEAYERLINHYNNELQKDNSNFEEINKKILELNSAYDYLINNIYNSSNNVDQNSILSNVKNLINSNQLDEARSQLWKLENRNAEWNYLMGQIYYKEGWYDKAQNHFQIAYNLEPNNLEYSQAHNSFNNNNNQFRQNYNKRTQFDTRSGCSCCDSCCTLLCVDSCCECCGCDFISCC